MKDIDKKLEAARERSENYGKLYGAKETADDYLKASYASIFGNAPAGTVAERDAWVRRQPAYLESIERKENAYADWKTAETYMKLLFAEAEVWRTEQANNRYLDSAHR